MSTSVPARWWSPARGPRSIDLRPMLRNEQKSMRQRSALSPGLVGKRASCPRWRVLNKPVTSSPSVYVRGGRTEPQDSSSSSARVARRPIRKLAAGRTAVARPAGAKFFDADFGVLLEIAVEHGVVVRVVQLNCVGDWTGGGRVSEN